MAGKNICSAKMLWASLKYRSTTGSIHYRSFSSLPSYGADATRRNEDVVNFDWDRLGFSLIRTDFMYTMKCSNEEGFSKGELIQYGNIELCPSAAVLNHGQGVFEGLKAYRKEDGHILLFRPDQNALRMKMGAERLCMTSPSVQQFVDAVKQTVLANRRWVPPPGKGALYIRPLLIGTSGLMALEPASEYTFLVFACPVGNYFKEGLSPINLLIEENGHRAFPGGTGGIKSITNYAPVLKAQGTAKSKGYSDVLYLDSVNKRYIEEVASCNIFIVKDNLILTPPVQGTILPGITRKSVAEVAHDLGYQVEERPVLVDELMDADEVFCTGTAVVVAPVGSITHLGKRVVYNNGNSGEVSRQLYAALTDIQTGRVEDRKGWMVAVD